MIDGSRVRENTPFDVVSADRCSVTAIAPTLETNRIREARIIVILYSV